MPVEAIDVDGLPGLVAQVLAIAKDQPPGSFLWFRGASLSSHSLLPKLLREGKGMEAVFDRERRMLTRFRQRSMAYWPAGYPQSDWEHLFAMQHFGMPTRLLDWSENLFVAAHFAFGVLMPEPQAEQDPPAVWCLNPISWNRATPVLSEFGHSIQVLTTSDDEIESYRPETNKRRNKSPVAIFGAHNSGRIIAQRGTFIVWGSEGRPLEEFANEMSQARIFKLSIRGDRASLASELSSLGFGETMVFPELPYLAVELSRVEGWR